MENFRKSETQEETYLDIFYRAMEGETFEDNNGAVIIARTEEEEEEIQHENRFIDFEKDQEREMNIKMRMLDKELSTVIPDRDNNLVLEYFAEFPKKVYVLTCLNQSSEIDFEVLRTILKCHSFVMSGLDSNYLMNLVYITTSIGLMNLIMELIVDTKIFNYNKQALNMVFNKCFELNEIHLNHTETGVDVAYLSKIISLMINV